MYSIFLSNVTSLDAQSFCVGSAYILLNDAKQTIDPSGGLVPENALPSLTRTEVSFQY